MHYMYPCCNLGILVIMLLGLKINTSLSFMIASGIDEKLEDVH
jgi:hypothetical protein